MWMAFMNRDGGAGLDAWMERLVFFCCGCACGVYIYPRTRGGRNARRRNYAVYCV